MHMRRIKAKYIQAPDLSRYIQHILLEDHRRLVENLLSRYYDPRLGRIEGPDRIGKLLIEISEKESTSHLIYESAFYSREFSTHHIGCKSVNNRQKPLQKNVLLNLQTVYFIFHIFEGEKSRTTIATTTTKSCNLGTQCTLLFIPGELKCTFSFLIGSGPPTASDDFDEKNSRRSPIRSAGCRYVTSAPLREAPGLRVESSRSPRGRDRDFSSQLLRLAPP